MKIKIVKRQSVNGNNYVLTVKAIGQESDIDKIKLLLESYVTDSSKMVMPEELIIKG